MPDKLSEKEKAAHAARDEKFRKENKSIYAYNEKVAKAKAAGRQIPDAEARRYSRSFKEAIGWALDLPAINGNPTVELVRKYYPKLNNRDAMAVAITAQAILKQDVKAFVAIRDTTGELPIQTVNLQNDSPMEITIKTVE